MNAQIKMEATIMHSVAFEIHVGTVTVSRTETERDAKASMGLNEATKWLASPFE